MGLFFKFWTGILSMAKIKKTLKILAVTLFILSTFIIGLLVWTIAYPKTAWNVTSHYLLPSDLNIAWEKINFRSHKISFLHYDISWSMENLSIEKSEPNLKIHADVVAAKLNLNPFSKNEWVAIETLKIHLKEKGHLRISQNKEPNPESQQSFFQTLESSVQSLGYANRGASVKNLDIQILEFVLFADDNPPMTLSASVLKDLSTENRILVKHEMTQDKLHLKVEGHLETQNLETKNSFLTAQLFYDSDKINFQSTVVGSYDGSQIKFNLSPVLKIGNGKSALNIDSKLELVLTEAQASLAGTANLKNAPGPIVSLQNISILVKMPMQNDRTWSLSPSDFKIAAPVDLFLINKDMRKPFEKACRCKMPESFQTQIEGQVWMDAYMSNSLEKEKIVNARMSLESIENKLFQADVAAGIIIYKENNQFVYEPTTDSHIKIFSFQGLRGFLDSKGVLIPAPLDILEGTLDLTAKAPVSQKDTRVVTQVFLDANLGSKNQKVDIALKASLDFSKALDDLKIDLKALIKTLKIELPPLDPILGFPSVIKDSRFLKKPRPSKNAKSHFTVHINSQIETESPGAIQLLTPLAKPNIPISLNVLTSDKRDPKASIKIEPFLISYLRRNIFVEKFEIKVKGSGENESPMEGRLRIEQGGYNVYINLAGTTDSPNVHLTSDPYLPEPDIISVLLYGRVTKNLAEGDAQTAGSVNAAVADRAIGIFGLWAFAVTPIQSFSYNPITKVYVATVKLGSGLTAGVGTNWEESTNLELRKRISNRWVLTASWSEASDSDRGEKLVLRWERRF